MEPLTIILLTIGIGVLVALVAWYGPRLRHWHRDADFEPDDRSVDDRSPE